MKKFMLFAGLALFSLHTFAQGTAFTYQGRLDDNGSPATGSYDFRFRLASDALGNNLVGGPLLSNAVPVSVGLFTVPLDFGAVFNGSNFWLQVDVKTNGASGYTTLNPLQRLTPTPYAIMANAASNLLGTLPTSQLTGTLPTSQLSGTVGNSQLADNSVTSAKIFDGSVSNVDLAADAVTSAKILNGTIVGSDLANNTVTSAQLADTVTLGDTSNSGRLELYGPTSVGPTISLSGSGSQISTFGYDGLEQIRLWGPSYGELLLKNSLANNATAVNLTAQGSVGGRLSLNNTNGSSRAVLEGENIGGLLTLYTADGNTGAILYGNEGAGSGSLSLRNTNGSSRLRAYGGPSSGSLELFDTDGTRTFLAQGAESSTAGSQLVMYQGNGAATVQLDAELGDGGGGYFSLHEGDGTETVAVAAGGGGNITLRQATGAQTISLAGASGSVTAVNFQANSGSSAAPGFTFVSDPDTGIFRPSVNTLAIASGGTERLRVTSDGSVGIGESNPGAALDVHRATNRVALFNRTGDDGVIIHFQRDGFNEGSISVAGNTVSYNAFTGSHYGWTDEKIEHGMLVLLTGENRRSQPVAGAEIIYGIAMTQTANDPRCLGSYLGLEEPSRPPANENPHQIMSVGNGEMWVTEGKSGDIQPGDFLISAAVKGCAMKDDPMEFPVGNICARAAERVNWRDADADEAGVKRRKISVLFESFVRDSRSTGRASVENLGRKLDEELKVKDVEIEQLKARLAALERLMVGGIER